jgi:hypothetical protein
MGAKGHTFSTFNTNTPETPTGFFLENPANAISA